jgi:hypothetical protein
MVFDPFDRFTPQDFVFKIARTPQEVEGFWALRRAIFCEEQKIFRGSDRDEVDRVAIPIICETLVAGMEDSVVGVVRIDEREPHVWYGSRLGVAPEFRRVKNQSRRGLEESSADLPRAGRDWGGPHLQSGVDGTRSWLQGISRQWLRVHFRCGSTSKNRGMGLRLPERRHHSNPSDIEPNRG